MKYFRLQDICLNGGKQNSPMASKSNPTRYLLFICLLIYTTPLEIHAAENDWEFWNAYSVSGNLGDNWRAAAGVEFKFDDDMSNHYYSHVDVGVDTRLAKWFRLGFNLPLYKRGQQQRLAHGAAAILHWYIFMELWKGPMVKPQHDGVQRS